jgi:hypothetical protein
MRQQPMIAQSDTQAAGNPIQQERNESSLPIKHKEGCNCAHMEQRHERRGYPIYLSCTSHVSPERFALRRGAHAASPYSD